VATLDNLDRLPVILSMTCLDGYWLYPGTTGLMETMLRAANGGSVASFSPTGLGLGTGHDQLERGLLNAVFRQRVSRLGAAALAGKVALYSSRQSYDLIDTFTVFGDPALRLPIGQEVYLPLVRR
jgi:Peptidase family C25